MTEYSEQTQQWLDEQATNSPAVVLANYARAAERAERQEERARAEKLADAQARRENMAFEMSLRGQSLPTLEDKFREWAALEEIENAREDRERMSEREAATHERAIKAEARRAALESELSVQQDKHLRTLRAANEALVSQRAPSSYRAPAPYWR
jgi:hypothetical protein